MPTTQSENSPAPSATLGTSRTKKGMYTGGIFGDTTCPDGSSVNASFCVALAPGQSYSFGLLIDDPSSIATDTCLGGLGSYQSPSDLAAYHLSLKFDPNQRTASVAVTPKYFTLTALANPTGITDTTISVSYFDTVTDLPGHCLPPWTLANNGITAVHVIFTPATPTPSPTPPCPPPATPGPNPASPIPVFQRPGVPVYGAPLLGTRTAPAYRPDDGHDPAFFLSQGASAGGIQGLTELVNFSTGKIWDEQRVGSIDQKIIPYRQTIGYASIAIGLFGCSAGIDQNLILSIYEGKAITGKSSWSARAPRDTLYPYLPAANVANVRIGYNLCKNNIFSYCH